MLLSLASLSETERAAVLGKLSPYEIRHLLYEMDEEYKQDPWLWLTQEVFTQDEATQSKRAWPDKGYLREFIHVLNTEKLIAVPKSRRMMISWTMALWSVYKARYFPHHAVFIQSETEAKAAFITDKRCVYIEDNLRTAPLRRKYRAIKTHQGLVGRITYNDTDSYIWAIAQGGSIIRTYTFSLLFMDESDFQPEGAEALLAALPIAEKGSQVVLVTTSNGPFGIVADICKSCNFTKFN